ncbi:MAG: hypothetical protein GY781_11670 [Gammaproteobacteria bacterium]|nr:hypothetical protein [Gammaproteobacteria bacterium]
MKTLSIIMLSLFSIFFGSFGQVQASAKLHVHVNKATHKMVKHKASGDIYPMQGPVIRVYSKGNNKYDSIANDNENLSFLVSVYANCNKTITSFSLKINDESKNVKHTSSNGEKVKKRTEIIKTPFTLPKISRTPVKACMNELDKRVALGNKSKADWMKSGFVVKYENAYEASVTGTCSSKLGKADFEVDREQLPVWIICEPIKETRKPKKNTGPSQGSPIPRGREAKKQNLKLALTASPKIIESCPGQIKFNGKITSTKAADIKYQIVGQDSGAIWKTPVKTITFKKPGTKSISQWTHSYHKPDTKNSFAIKSPGGPKPVKGKAQIVIIKKPPNTSVSGGLVNYDIWCDGKPKRQPAKPKAARKSG